MKKVILVILIIILACLSFLLWKQYQRVVHVDYVNAQRLKISEIIHTRPLTATDITRIEPWMTFDYINQAWKIPADYLKSTLNITDARYPRISLARLARETHTDINVFMDQVKSAVQTYFLTPTAHE
jgi:hypothetical protein